MTIIFTRARRKIHEHLSSPHPLHSPRNRLCSDIYLVHHGAFLGRGPNTGVETGYAPAAIDPTVPSIPVTEPLAVEPKDPLVSGNVIAG